MKAALVITVNGPNINPTARDSAKPRNSKTLLGWDRCKERRLGERLPTWNIGDKYNVTESIENDAQTNKKYTLITTGRSSDSRIKNVEIDTNERNADLINKCYEHQAGPI